MSLSSYIKRQSRVIRRSTVVSSAGLCSILEEPTESITTEKKPKKNSMKAKRRLGVSDLSIPHTSPLFTAVQGLDDNSEWRLRLPEVLLEDGADDTTFDFPRPPIPIFGSPHSDELESESSGSEGSEGSRSGSESPMSSGMPTTPTPSPTAESYVAAEAELRGQCVIRCKSIKPLIITKRSVSPIPPPVPSSSTLPAASSSASRVADEYREDNDNDAWQDDDEYYAAHASGFITLAPPLPPSFPSSSAAALPATPAASTARAVRRESAIIPASTTVSTRPSVQLDPSYAPQRASVRLSRTITIPTRAPPPPPIITTGCHSRSGSSSQLPKSPNPSPTTRETRGRTRPPPKTPVPMDALSTPWSGDYTAYAPLFTPSPSADSSSSSTSSRLDALLSPPAPRRFPAEAQGVPSDVDADDDGEWEECTYDEFGSGFDDVPLSPLVASAPSPDTEEVSPVLAVERNEAEAGDKWTFPPSPLPRPFPIHGLAPPPRAPRNSGSLSSRSSPPRAHLRPVLIILHRAYRNAPPPRRPPVLRSRWSSSTLSSIHSAHARSPASPKTFSFARRYFNPHSKVAKSPRTKAYPKPMGSATVLSPPKKRKGGKRLTVEDVLIVGRPPAPAPTDVLAAPPPPTTTTKPFSFSALSPASATPATPYSTTAQWAAYPASPVPAPPLQSPSPALYAAYTTQRSPRRRASNASTSAWSYSSRSSEASPPGSTCGGSDSGHSDTSTGSGLRRKPIPLEIFFEMI
ncbi:hypothetical protein MVEN_01386400 [Mycena venus]|uniref:Uncharacterized protein n=1 Tax=Mycena venus TaxID=2733690 RepID=A0A8H6XY34_9AGAR|nr:hypothetical protein MVEN_01386400 [Mycena venus]